MSWLVDQFANHPLRTTTIVLVVSLVLDWLVVPT